MKNKYLLGCNFKYILFAIIVLLNITSCAQIRYLQDPLSGGTPPLRYPEYILHTFESSDRSESPNIEVLDYQYGNSRPAASEYESVGVLQKDRRNGVGNRTGVIKRGEFFYIKWKNIISNVVFERRIDLKEKLPIDIYDHTISYSIRDDKLTIYLVTLKDKPANVMQNVPNRYANKVVLILYSE